MSGEGEGRSAAPKIWRLRWVVGCLFALAAPGGALAGTARAAVPTRAFAETLVAPALRPASLAVFAALSVLLASALQPSRKAVRSLERRLPRASGVTSRPARRSVPGPGPARELLALFERPRSTAEWRQPEAQDSAPLGPTFTAEVGPRLRLFGPLRLEGRDEAVLRQRAVRGLIAYLALRPGPADFDDLAEALWPGQDPERSRPRVHKAKQNAQRLLGEAISRRGAAYLLDPTRLRTDASEIAELAGAGASRDQLERAVELAVGEPLADIDYAFAETERRRLRSVRIDLFARVAAARLDERNARAALEAAEQLIALDRLNELGWRLAMEAEAALGARQAVVERYGLLELELDAALGLRPDAETRSTYRRLLSQA